MKSLDTISEDLFNKIRGRFPSVTIGNEEGKVTNDPKEARFFDFDYKSDGKNIGKVSVSVSDESVAVMYTSSFMEDQDEVTREKWYNFLKELRTFAKKRLLKFDTRDITKTNLDRRDYKFLAQNSGEMQMSESKLYGTNKVSYQRIGEARLNIRHRCAVNPEQPASRTRNIDRIYIESPEGERFKYPYRHLAGARAMARHVSEGGNPYDDFGQHVVGLSEELNNLKKFKTYVGRSKVMAEGLSQYMDIVEGRAKDVKKELESIQKSNGYASFIENYESVVLEDVPDDVKTNWIDELTIKQFNEDLKDVFPYIYRLIGEGRRAKEIGPDNFDSALEEDTALEIKRKMQESLDMDPEKLAQLVDAMSTDLVNDDVDSVIEKLDQLLDSDIEKANFLQMIVPNIDVSPESEQKLAAKMQEYERGTQDESEQETTEEHLPITEFILSHYDKETGSWPRGETAVLTGVEKDYGDQYIETAKQFIERINQTYSQFSQNLEESNSLKGEAYKAFNKLGIKYRWISDQGKKFIMAGSWPRDEDAQEAVKKLRDYFNDEQGLITAERQEGHGYFGRGQSPNYIVIPNEVFSEIQEGCGCDDDSDVKDSEDTDEDFERLKNLAGL